jgi:FMN reductase [NAD(P)H]
MEGIVMNSTIKVMKNHRSIRNYLDNPVPDNVIDELVAVAQAAPNSVNGQQSTIIVVRDKEKKAKIAQLAGGQKWVDQAPLLFIFVVDFYKAKLAAKKVGKPLVAVESLEAIVAASLDIGVGMQSVITAAESLGLGTVPIGGIRRNPEELIKLLDLPELTFPMNGLVIGYPADMSAKKPRMPAAAYRHDEKYDKGRLAALIDEYDLVMASYLKSIGREEVEGDWSRQTMSYYSKVYFPEVYPVMKAQGFANDK